MIKVVKNIMCKFGRHSVSNEEYGIMFALGSCSNCGKKTTRVLTQEESVDMLVSEVIKEFGKGK